MIDHPPLWAWMVRAADGRWGIIGALIPGVGPTQLVCGSESTAEALRRIAEAHQRKSGLPVRLVRFTAAEVVEDMGARGHA